MSKSGIELPASVASRFWGTVRVVEVDAVLVGKLMPPSYRARIEQVILFNVTACHLSCPQHIPQRFEAAVVKTAMNERGRRIAELEAEAAFEQIHIAAIQE